MAEKFKTLQNKNESLSFENKFVNSNTSVRSESGAVIRKHKTPPKSLTPRSHSYSYSAGWQRKNEMESLRVIATPTKVNATFSRVKHVTGSNCSSPVRRNDKPFSTGRENNSSSRLGQPAKKFIPSSHNDIFFKELWENIVNRYPEWMQKIWRNRQQEQLAKYLQGTSEIQTGDKTINDSRDAEESIREVESTLTPISEEEQDSLSSLFHSASATEAYDTTDVGNEDSVVTQVGQRSFSSRTSLERSSSENSEICNKVVEWRDWSLQLTSDGKLIITGKSDQNTLTKSRDVSTWERVDAHTLRHRRDGSVYKLVGAADHFVCQDLPSYVRTKFQYGFPEEWLQIRDMWMKYKKEGNPNFVWSADTDYNRVKSGMNATFAGSSTTYSDHIPELPSENTKSVNIKIKSTMQNVSEKQKKTEREAMKDLSNITHKRPLYKAHSLNALSPKAANEAVTLKNVTQKTEPTKVPVKTAKASKKAKNEVQVLRNWYPLISEGGLKYSGILESAENNVKHTTRIVVKADTRTRTISCCCGERYQLIGDLEASACSAPEFIKTKFKSGIPYRWKVVVKEWLETTELSLPSHRARKEQNYAESDTEDQGERITVYGVNPVYCPSPGASGILQTREQADLNSPRAKKKKCETSVPGVKEINKTMNKGIKKRLYQANS